jgi:hypothetical protein
MSIVVVQHSHEPDSGVYRLVVAQEVWDSRPVVEDGEDGPQVVERDVLLGHAHHEDFVFSADADEYDGRTPEQIADMQRKAVRKALDAREAGQPAVTYTALPGEGEEL